MTDSPNMASKLSYQINSGTNQSETDEMLCKCCIREKITILLNDNEREPIGTHNLATFSYVAM